ncbi:molybdopterin-dependent oxidoreductase [Blautia sp. RD014234]|nr:molybdopterin-dependent oxidoreductase [Blautia parvula]
MDTNKSDLKYVGKSYIREDVYDKARGKTKYTCDRQIAGMLYAKLVLSEKANADITIRTEKAKQVPGVRAVFTHANVPKIPYNPHNWSACLDAPMDQYILSEKARYVGDHLALVVGETKAAVEEAVSLVEIDYDEAAPVIGLNAARKTEGMLAFEKEVSCGDYEALTGDGEAKDGPIVVSTEGSTQKIHHSAIEPHIALSEIDENGNLVLWTPCQTVYQVRYHISHLLGIPYTKVRVIKAVMGGSFGGKGQTVVEPACAFATWILRCPVMLYMDRQDAVMGTRSRNATETRVKTAVTRDGVIRGRRIDADIDGGAYYTNASAIAMAYCKNCSACIMLRTRPAMCGPSIQIPFPGRLQRLRFSPGSCCHGGKSGPGSKCHRYGPL